MPVEPFKIEIPDAVLDDLKARLERTRWPDELPGVGWEYGSNMDYIKELVEYWKNDFDWRKQEALINSFSHFKAPVDGRQVHFIHEKGKGAEHVAADNHPRLARHLLRDAQGHSAAGRPGRPRRRPRRRLRRRGPFDARLRLLRRSPGTGAGRAGRRRRDGEAG